ncbi:N-acetyltransferase [Zooshikella marina]|uniref:acyltransferase n=1 Tax=Zooshikella ganghwensis TaxID=202772 RepID=UPI001B7FA5B3|nr:acyltransferase [Zooshikella ganghwensis]MBU2704620.1 N-acetyltransferase [Zooshikella ganghwensis]
MMNRSDGDIYIHQTAEISPTASIGVNTKIWNNAQVRDEAIIGNNCIISKDVYIDTRVEIGNGCKIQNSVSVYFGVTIEDDVFIGPHTSFTNDKTPRAFNNNWEVTKTQIKKGASLGANCTIVCGVNIGEYAMIAAGAVVTKDVEPYTLVMGNPAKKVCKIDINGNKLK